jgi:hypothetical protein
MSETETPSNASKYFLCFLAGVVLTLALFGIRTVLNFLLTGDEIACASSFPRYHKACVYSRFGLGDQALTLTIDGKAVYQAEDFPGGNLNEKITWDPGAQKVTFHINGLGDRIFNAE